MALNAIFSLSCPACGAEVPVYSASSVLVVCEYCQSTLVRSGDSAVDSGRKSAIIENFSPLQLHTSGMYQNEPFEIVGRLQIQYDRGYWNEWYVLFGDGGRGWLADYSGHYVLTKRVEDTEATLPFNRLKAGVTRIRFRKNYFIAADVRSSKSISANAQGELPFTLKDDELVLSADFRYLNEFITLDYSENPNAPIIYEGHMVTLDKLRCQNLRSDDQILSSAGKLKGQRAPLSCPNCGASLNWYPGAAQNVLCPSCHSEISLDGAKAKVMETHSMRQVQSEDIVLKLGEIARIGGTGWTVIGFVFIAELVGSETLRYIENSGSGRPSYELGSQGWYEYLLYNPIKGFLWLVESDGEWTLSHSADIWPEVSADIVPMVKNRALPRLYRYGGRVEYAAGAFYWRVEPGDITYYQDFIYDGGKMSAERTREELSWSVSRPVTGDELAEWFKRSDLKYVVAKRSGINPHKNFAIMLLLAFFAINIPPIVTAFSNDGPIPFVVGICFVVTAIVWHPFYEAGDDDDDD